MVTRVENLSTASVGFALDAATLRHQAIASNIANVNTEGYVPQKLSFASQIEQMQVFFDKDRRAGAASLSEPRLVLSPSLDAQGQPTKVELDMEVAAMAQNSVHYQSLIKGLSRHYAILASAVSDGKK